MSEALKRAMARGSLIKSGVWVTVETSQQNTLESLTDEIVALGGMVVKVSQINAPARTGSGERPNRRVFVIDAVLPDGVLPEG